MNEKIYEKPETVEKEADFAFQDAEEIVKDGLENLPEGEIRTDEEPYPKKVLPKWLYDLLCFIARFLLPASAAAYGALAAIWGLPHGEAIVSTISVLIIFLSTVLALDAKEYFREGV